MPIPETMPVITEAVSPFLRFELRRETSCTTYVTQAWGVVFPDGRVAVEQRNNMMCLYKTIDDLCAVIDEARIQYISWID